MMQTSHWRMSAADATRAADVHQHASAHGGEWLAFEVLAIAVLGCAAAGYAAALWFARDRGPWQLYRTVAWYAGLGCVAVALVGPLASASHRSFTAHMVGHLLLGMTGPLLMVLAAPVTLVLRALPVARARTVTRVLRRRAVVVVTHPIVAATLNAGGLWVLYTTPLFPAMHGSALVHGVVHAHIFLAGYLLTYSLIGVDPNPHRASITVRAITVIAFIAAHQILAKWLYAHPPPGVGRADGEAGAQVMFYGGDLVDVFIIVLLFAQWYSRRGRSFAGATARASVTP